MGIKSKEDRELIQLLKNPKTLGDLAKEVSYSEKTLARRLKRLVEEGLIYIIGKTDSGGRPKYIYCAFKHVKNPDHELYISKVEKNVGVEFTRGFDVNPDIRPDWEFGKMFGEMETGKNNLNFFRSRMKLYADIEEFPFVVCLTETRMNNVLKFGLDYMLATTLEEALRPNPRCWDCSFEEYSVTKILNKQRENLAREKRKPSED